MLKHPIKKVNITYLYMKSPNNLKQINIYTILPTMPETIQQIQMPTKKPLYMCCACDSYFYFK